MKIVLYQPQQTNKRTAGQSNLDMLPLEMLQIAAFPLQDGHSVTIIDGSLYDQDDAHRRVVEACADAGIFATTGILGWMVSDGYVCAEKVRAAHPKVKRIIGGWFTSVMPHLHLKDGVFDAAALGQGELTFRDLVAAIDSGASLEDVAGLALWRDGAVHHTAHRSVVGFDRLPDPAWHLLDFTPYREGQMRPEALNYHVRMPGPPWIGKKKHYVGISYFSSFGCPEPCSFCCSPTVTERRWKAKPAEKMLDDLQMLQERWGKIDVVRFHDANFGVMQKRTRAFAEGLLARDMKIGWNAFIETYSINDYDPKTLDLCAESGYYVAEVGAETGDPETMKRVGKPIKGDANFEAAARLHDRGIAASITYIIGFPYEPESSMIATLNEARRVQLRCPSSSTHVLPFRPIPGTKMYELALELGYKAPDDIHFWGGQTEYHLQQTWSVIPPRVARLRNLHNHYTTLFKGVARGRQGVFEKLATWRLENDNMSFPIDAKLFTVVDRVERKLLRRKAVKKDLVDQALG
jgi:anaerobic magnesium-protoporphyrin IX monomethyl ester cyclase